MYDVVHLILKLPCENILYPNLDNLSVYGNIKYKVHVACFAYIYMFTKLRNKTKPEQCITSS